MQYISRQIGMRVQERDLPPFQVALTEPYLVIEVARRMHVQVSETSRGISRLKNVGRATRGEPPSLILSASDLKLMASDCKVVAVPAGPMRQLE